MTRILRFLTVLVPAFILIAAPVHADEVDTITVIVEGWAEVVPAARFVSGAQNVPVAIDSFGPFRVIDSEHAALVDVTDTSSPAYFSAMLTKYAGLKTLELVEAPGTLDDRANLQLGRLIRAAGLQTHVPAHGSVRSGAVELVFAGIDPQIDDGAEFAVHAWMDDLGQSATDYGADAPEHRKYIGYYLDMGVDPDRANAFYAMTNSTPFESARWLDAAEMRVWMGLDESGGEPETAAPKIAYLNF